MSVIEIFILVVSVSSICFILFQLWYFVENYNNIVEFNDKYRNLEFSKSANINFQDNSVRDPNDYTFNVDDKWRCSLENNIYYPVSIAGFLSTSSTSIGMTYNNERDCIVSMFSVLVPVIYNPCTVPTSLDCALLNRLM